MNAQTAPMVTTPVAVWILLAGAALLVVISLIKPKRKEPKPRHDAVSWKVLWWRKLAPAEAVRRELAPHEPQFDHLASLGEYFDAQADAEEGDHANA